MWDRLWINARLATFVGPRPYGALEPGALAVAGDRLAYVGSGAEAQALRGQAEEVVDAGGRWITPGLIDCHTHLVHGGHRAAEFEQRLQGVSYQEIARRGGGILATVRATREADEETLVGSAGRRLRDLLAEGVTTVEIKSGYGLDTATELRMLRAARRLGREHPVEVVTTFLGAHAVPPEYAGRTDDYLELVCEEMLPVLVAEELADAVDAFCEGIAFTVDECARVFAAAAGHGLPVKLHAEQLSDSGGAELVARQHGLSADHLEYLSPAGVRALAAAGTVAVLLPGAFHFLRETRRPPVDLLRRHGVPIALATDANPGSSPLTSILTALNLGCVLFGLTPEEALTGVTRHAARALGLSDRGTLRGGQRADFALWDVDHLAQLPYALGANPCHTVVQGGEIVLSGA